MVAVADHAADVPITGERFGFATLERAQAAGDLRALGMRGRRGTRARFDESREVGR